MLSFPRPSGASGQPSILWLLRDHFVNNVDADGSGHLSRDDRNSDTWDEWDSGMMGYDGMNAVAMCGI